jgi:acetyl-CoA carboxylase biotin carboxyl carrier protein
MDIRKIKKLIELLEESGIAEIEIREGEESVRIARQAPAASGHNGPIYMTAPPPAAAHVAPAPAPAAVAATVPASATAATAGLGETVVPAPMVGTYYSSPSPGAKQFIAIGDEVQPGQVLCIIEAMKMMNQIECEVAGKVRAMLVKNGEPVEFGQPLFIFEQAPPHARQDRHSQPRRNRAAHPAGLPRTGHQDRGRAFHG